MSIERLLTNVFPTQIRSRGRAYAENGLVRLIAASTNEAEFRVRGSSQYKVRILYRPDQNEVRLDCDCPYAFGGDLCKHLWACILVADRKHILTDLAASESVHLMFNGDIGEEEDLGDEDEQGEDFLSTYPYDPSQGTTWRMALERAELKLNRHGGSLQRPSTIALPNKIAHFALDLAQSVRTGQIQILPMIQERLKSGSLGVLRSAVMDRSMIREFFHPEDREILMELFGKTDSSTDILDFGVYRRQGLAFALDASFSSELLAKISATGRLLLLKAGISRYRSTSPDLRPYIFSADPWRVQLELKKVHENYVLAGEIKNATETRSPGDVIAVVDSLAFFEDQLAPLQPKGANLWLTLLKERRSLEIPIADVEGFLSYFYLPEHEVPMRLPAELEFREISNIAPKGRLSISRGRRHSTLLAHLGIAYGDILVPFDYQPDSLTDVRSRQRILRHTDSESSIKNAVVGADSWLRSFSPAVEQHFEFKEAELPKLAAHALTNGWEVFAQQNPIRLASNVNLKMSSKSGVDWFELNGSFTFDQQQVSLPELLQNLGDNSRLIRLGDGSLGIVPEEWLRKLRVFTNMGKSDDAGIRLSRIQALFLSASLEESESLKPDARFATLRAVIEDIRQMKSLSPTGLTGKLRPYQKVGLGWLATLERHQLGGVLADDMGLGKTVQILAHLASRKSNGQPSLIVAPKTLIFNWLSEIEKFTPQLRALNYSGMKRHASTASFSDYDIVLTTYPCLRTDIEKLGKIKFDLFVLDEAHYIKNPKSQAAMACRLISANQKFGLTGTPIENSLGDLFSILAVVNPGLVSEPQAQKWSGSADPEVRATLARALSPFLLRRTKDQVLKDLPEKFEQILYCELSPSERKKYDELKTYYWAQLSSKVQSKGLSRSKIEVLEALLRLRQAACHQALLDKKSSIRTSAKFELLLEQIEAVIQDGHKALIFSQFTTLLGLLVSELKDRDIEFEYLDGKTKDRKTPVERFQNDPSVKLFLLSLKAGGVGLNLTAADYVFVLDPWWNPAAEAQAIDRAHRIGQTKKVFAYKIIAKDTVEEKILELQKSKKELAAAIVGGNQSLLKNLQMADLEKLFT